MTVAGVTGFSSTVSAAPLINGGHISDAISVVGEEDVYTFTASVGDHVEFRMVDTSLSGDLVPRIELYGPSGGNALAAGQSHTVAYIAYTIQESGTFTLLAKDASTYQDCTGSYNLYYVKIPGANELGTPTNGGVLSETIAVGDPDTFTFTAVAGDHVEIRMVDTSASGDLLPRIELYGPSGGNSLTSDQSYTVASIAYTVPESGTYTLLAKDNTSSTLGPFNTGSYDLYYVKVPGADEIPTPTNGGVFSETIDVGDLDTYSFTALAGDHVEIRMADTSVSGDLTPRIELYGPSGGNYLTYGQSVTVAAIAYTVPESFTYTFIANVGETFDIEITDTSTSGDLLLRIELYGPSGGSYLTYGYDQDVAYIHHTTTEIGTYTVLVKDANSGAWAIGDYEINCVTDGDNDIDGEDLYQFIVDYTNKTEPYADMDGNGTIDDEDVARFAREFGKH
ncbi:MAG: hypothetical protein KKA54_21355 [Proteobacteria bacterium]|nr:hypothetical protein [Pseudomonadota bacterium]MBU0968912.1 hypothetical protein [Pseudomonadota bacterium]